MIREAMFVPFTARNSHERAKLAGNWFNIFNIFTYCILVFLHNTCLNFNVMSLSATCEFNAV